ncbi:MAG: thioredoxin [Terrimonas sp.]|nr:thioredoxin [Terrimonas sp.]
METNQKKETFSDILNGDTPVLVDFTAVWCGPCKMMKPVLEELHQKMGDSLRILKIDIDRNPQVATAYQVQSVPTLILFKKGKNLWRQSGVLPAGQLEKSIRKYAEI